MSNYYLCDYCSVKHVGGEGQSFLPRFICAVWGGLEGKRVMSDKFEPKEVCPDYKPKEAKVVGE